MTFKESKSERDVEVDAGKAQEKGKLRTLSNRDHSSKVSNFISLSFTVKFNFEFCKWFSRENQKKCDKITPSKMFLFSFLLFLWEILAENVHKSRSTSFKIWSDCLCLFVSWRFSEGDDEKYNRNNIFSFLARNSF